MDAEAGNAEAERKLAVLKRLYYTGFPSRKRLFKEVQAHEQALARAGKPILYPTTFQYVNDWYDSMVGRQRYYGMKNSFVAPHAHWEYQVDLFQLKHLKDQTYQWGMACIDIFSKYATVVPLETKGADDYQHALVTCINKMGRPPKFIMSDQEGALKTYSMTLYFERTGIQLIQTWSHAHFVERFIRTFKSMLNKNLEAAARWNRLRPWHKYIKTILSTYNTRYEHSATGMKPSEARETENEAGAKLQLSLKQRHNRTYPPLQEGDRVKTLLTTSKNKFRKEHTSIYSDLSYEITGIDRQHGQTFYIVNGSRRLRNELFKVT